VDGFSTLGFFKDPLYSFMKDFSIFGIASLIIHEQTHATVYVKNQVQFSEELATFVGNTGAMNFIRQKYGIDSDIYRSAILAEQDREAYLNLLRDLYNEFKKDVSERNQQRGETQEKRRDIADFKEKVSTEYNRFFKTEATAG
jgi:predicted aminopeptidase